jgi:hypothetical protein
MRTTRCTNTNYEFIRISAYNTHSLCTAVLYNSLSFFRTIRQILGYTKIMEVHDYIRCTLDRLKMMSRNETEYSDIP